MERSNFCLFQSAFFLHVLKESAKLHALAPTRLTHIRKLLACAPAHWCALPIIDIGITRLRAYALLPSSISTLRAFFSPCIVFLQLKDKVPIFTCSFSFLYFRSLFSPLFIQFCSNILTFSVLYFFWNKLNRHSIFTHLTKGQIL